MQQRNPLTQNGAEILRAELQKLKEIDRPRIASLIAEARDHGDLKENAEYHAAKEEQGFIEGRIEEIESKLSNGKIIDIRNIPNTGKVVFGVTVTIQPLNKKNSETYTIVGEDEANQKDLLSYKSPLAKAMIGSFEEDVFLLETDQGDFEYKIIKVVHK